MNNLQGAVNQHFLMLVSSGDDLLRSLLKGDVRIDGEAKMRLDAFKSNLSVARVLVPHLNSMPTERTSHTPFDGGPISNPPGGQGEAPPFDDPNANPPADPAEFQRGADLARADEPLPAGATGALKRGYYSVKPPFADPNANRVPDPSTPLSVVEQPAAPAS